MKRMLVSTLVGAVIYYVWQMMAWMVVPLHGPTVGVLPNEDTVTHVLTGANIETGMYVIPSLPEEGVNTSADERKKKNEDWVKRHRNGPIVSIFYTREGGAPMSVMTMLCGLVIDLIGAAIVTFLLSLAVENCPTYLSRVRFVAMFGLFLAVAGHVAYWNWMWFPTDHTLAMVADVLAGWTLAGLAIAAIIKPGQGGSATQEKAAATE